MERQIQMILNGIAFLVTALVLGVGQAALTQAGLWFVKGPTFFELMNGPNFGLLALIYFGAWLGGSHVLSPVAYSYLLRISSRP